MFLAVTPDVQQKIGREDIRFALAVLRSDPWGVLRTMVRNSSAQLITFSFDEFKYTRYHTAQYDQNFPPKFVHYLQRSRAYQGTIPTTTFSLLNYFCVFLAAAYLLARPLLSRSGVRVVSSWMPLITWVLVGIALNAAICGSISGVFPRQEARVVWLLPLVALLVEFAKPASREAQSALSGKLESR